MPRPSRNLTRTSVYLDGWLVEAADTLAEAERITRSEMLRRLVAEALRARAAFHEDMQKSPPPPEG